MTTTPTVFVNSLLIDDVDVTEMHRQVLWVYILNDPGTKETIAAFWYGHQTVTDRDVRRFEEQDAVNCKVVLQ